MRITELSPRLENGQLAPFAARIAMPHVAIFCSTQELDPSYKDPSIEFVDRITRAGFGVVWGVADVGLMGEVAQVARNNSSHLIGVAIEKSIFPAGRSDELFTMPNTPTRIAMMLKLAEAAAVLPGGSGTTDELTSVNEAKANGHFSGPVTVLNINEHYRHIAAHYQHLENKGFLRRTLAETVYFAQTPEAASNHILQNVNMSMATYP
jgi:uncharacterized protein (TIGR00730 family)